MLSAAEAVSSNLHAWSFGREKAPSAPNTRRPSVRRASEESHGGARCVRRLDDSLNSAIHTRYRSLLRSSSKREPRGPPLGVVSRIDDDLANGDTAPAQSTNDTSTDEKNGAKKHADPPLRVAPQREGATRHRLSRLVNVAHGATDGPATSHRFPPERWKGREEGAATIDDHRSVVRK